MKSLAKATALLAIGLGCGYGVGAWQWRGMAVVESYAIGFDHGYVAGMSDGAIPGAEVIGVGPDGKITSRRINPRCQ